MISYTYSTTRIDIVIPACFQQGLRDQLDWETAWMSFQPIPSISSVPELVHYRANPATSVESHDEYLFGPNRCRSQRVTIPEPTFSMQLLNMPNQYQRVHQLKLRLSPEGRTKFTPMRFKIANKQR